MTDRLLYVLSWPSDGSDRPSFQFFRSDQALEMSQHVVEVTKQARSVDVGQVAPPGGDEDSDKRADRQEAMLADLTEAVREMAAAVYARPVGGKAVRPTSPAKGPGYDPHELRRRAKAAREERLQANATAGDGLEGGVEAAPPAGWVQCQSCLQHFDPLRDVILNCVECDEPKCTAYCIGNELRPCTDCRTFREAVAQPDGKDDDGGDGADGWTDVPAPPSPPPVRPAPMTAEEAALERLADQQAVPMTTTGPVNHAALLARVPAVPFNAHLFDGQPPIPPKGGDA